MPLDSHSRAVSPPTTVSRLVRQSSIITTPPATSRLMMERHRVNGGVALEGAEPAQDTGEANGLAAVVNHCVTRVQQDPLNPAPTVALMEALVAMGDTASALACGTRYVDLVSREFGTPADPSVTSLIAALGAPSTEAAAAGPSAAPTTSAAPVTGTPDDREHMLAPDSRTIATTPSRPRRPRRALIVAAALVAVIAALAMVLSFTPAGISRPGASVAIFPFTVSGSEDLQYLSHGLVDLLSTSLDGAGTRRAVDPRVLFASLDRSGESLSGNRRLDEIAGRLGADHFVIGAVSGARSRVRLLAALYAVGRPDTAIATAVTEGDASSMSRLVDKLASQLLAGSFPERRVRLSGMEHATSGLEPALKQYLTGEDALRAGRTGEAVSSFQRATQLDTGFALAYFRLAVAAASVDDEALGAAALDMAARFRARLSRHDASLMDAAIAMRSGDLARAERRYREVVDAYPDDVEAWLQYGELVFHHQALRGRSADQARTAFEHVLAVDPGNTSALLHLRRIASQFGRTSEADSLERRLSAHGADRELLDLDAVRAFVVRSDSLAAMTLAPRSP